MLTNTDAYRTIEIDRPILKPIIIYTDATGLGGLGGTLSDGDNNLFFRITYTAIAGLNSPKKGILFYESKAADLALRLWQKLISGRQVVLFQDNTGVQSDLQRGFSSNIECACLVGQIWSFLRKCHCEIWIERVDSLQNLADRPSRGFRPYGKRFKEVPLQETLSLPLESDPEFSRLFNEV